MSSSPWSRIILCGDGSRRCSARLADRSAGVFVEHLPVPVRRGCRGGAGRLCERPTLPGGRPSRACSRARRPNKTSRCFASHKFGAMPVDVAKTADRQTVLAQLSWGFHDSIGCYLALDTAAATALRSANT